MSSLLSFCILAALAAVSFGCSDVEDPLDCEYWADEGYCTRDGYEDYMQERCYKSCAYCSDDGGSDYSGSDYSGSDDSGSDDSGEDTSGEDATGDWNGSCGKPETSPFTKRNGISSFIVGGKEAKTNSIPWQLSMQTPGGWHFCGASIINENWAVTAAHCVNEGDNIKVVAGAHSKSSSGQKYQVQRIYKHEEYNPNRMYNDIAMLEIGGSGIVMSDAVMPVCLPSKGYEWQTGQDMLVSGWGTLKSGGVSPDVLMQVTVPLVDFDKCARQNSMSRSWKDVICAGLDVGGRDSCQGDSGGPLVGQVDGYAVLAGVVSWGYGCADAELPGVYTHVSHYIDWMNGIMGQ